MAIRAGQEAAATLLEAPYSDIFRKVDRVSELVQSAALVLGLFRTLRSPYLRRERRINEQIDGYVKPMDLVAWVLCSTTVLARFAIAWVEWNRLNTARMDGHYWNWNIWNDIAFAVHQFSDVPEYFLLLVLTFLVAQVAGAARQEALGMMKSMPSASLEGLDSKHLSSTMEEVHMKCVRLLEDSKPSLVSCGWPLLLLSTFTVPVKAFNAYGVLQLVWVDEGARADPKFWLQSVAYASHMAATVWAVLVGPIQLSAARNTVEDKLHEQREFHPSLHQRIEAVETMLAKVNRGQGWGIIVFDGFVLSKEFLQMVLIRLLLAGTVIKAFLDSQLGFDAEVEDYDERLDSITGMLRNITGLIQKQYERP